MRGRATFELGIRRLSSGFRRGKALFRHTKDMPREPQSALLSNPQSLTDKTAQLPLTTCLLQKPLIHGPIHTEATLTSRFPFKGFFGLPRPFGVGNLPAPKAR